jgi:hypothetical protein
LGPDALVRWDGNEVGQVALVNPLTGKTYRTWSAPNSGTAVSFAAVDANRLYVVNQDASAVAFQRSAD